MHNVGKMVQERGRLGRKLLFSFAIIDISPPVPIDTKPIIGLKQGEHAYRIYSQITFKRCINVSILIRCTILTT